MANNLISVSSMVRNRKGYISAANQRGQPRQVLIHERANRRQLRVAKPASLGRREQVPADVHVTPIGRVVRTDPVIKNGHQTAGQPPARRRNLPSVKDGHPAWHSFGSRGTADRGMKWEEFAHS